MTALEFTDPLRNGGKSLEEYFRTNDFNVILPIAESKPTKKQRMDSFFGSVQWEDVSSNLEKLPYYAKQLEELKHTETRPMPDDRLFTFAVEPNWKEMLDPQLLKRMGQIITDYEEAQRRCRLLRITPEYMRRKNDVLRILYARNQEDDYTLDELYHCFDHMFPTTTCQLRHALTEGGWMYARPEERMDFFDYMPAESIRYWELFCDFRCGGYRLLPNIICDFDDLYSRRESRKRMLTKKGDSEDLQWLLLDIDKDGNYQETLIRRCRSILNPMDGKGRIDSHDVVKYAVALGKRQFALEIYPATVVELAIYLNEDEKYKKRKWRWPWDAERN